MTFSTFRWKKKLLGPFGNLLLPRCLDLLVSGRPRKEIFYFLTFDGDGDDAGDGEDDYLNGETVKRCTIGWKRLCTNPGQPINGVSYQSLVRLLPIT